MSTAGKVLTVLILLVMVAWLVMMSAVTQLNVNYGLKVKAQQEESEKVAAEAEKANTDFLDVTEKARLQQDLTERDLRLKLGAIVSAERLLSSTREDLSRITYQKDNYEVAVKKSQTNLENREAEKVKGEADLAKIRDEIAKAQALNADLKTQLAQLQDAFKRILADNAAKVKAPGVKPVSTSRELPST